PRRRTPAAPGAAPNRPDLAGASHAADRRRPGAQPQAGKLGGARARRRTALAEALRPPARAHSTHDRRSTSGRNRSDRQRPTLAGAAERRATTRIPASSYRPRTRNRGGAGTRAARTRPAGFRQPRDLALPAGARDGHRST